MGPYQRVLSWLLLLLVVGCQGAGGVDRGEVIDTRRGACVLGGLSEAEEVVIGAIMPLSAPGAAGSGEVMKVAYEIAAEEINGEGGIGERPLRLVVRDTAGSPEVGSEVVRDLIENECVAGIVGEYHSAVGLAVNEIAHEYGVPIIFAETYNDDITAKGYAETFRIAPTSTFTAQMDGKWLAEVGDYNGDGLMLAVVIAEDSSYGEGQIERAETWFPEFGISLEVIVVGDDFGGVAEAIGALRHKPDAIFIKVTGDDSYQVQNVLQAAGLGPNGTSLVVANQVALQGDAYWEAVPKGAYVVVPRIGPWATTVTAKGEAFVAKYQAVYDRWPEAYAFEAYDSLWLMADGIERANSLVGGEIVAALEETDLELAAGRYRFPYGSANPAGGYVPEFMWHQWPDVPLLFVQYTEIGQSPEEMAVIWPSLYRTTETAVIEPK
ncbi:MAG TPA: ABC transporter substrate-binding protein [Anaerolineae bacterium]|nr:ABC transporter substrate-binding protein [Anaerolineae bacterium]